MINWHLSSARKHYEETPSINKVASNNKSDKYAQSDVPVSFRELKVFSLRIGHVRHVLSKPLSDDLEKSSSCMIKFLANKCSEVFEGEGV